MIKYFQLLLITLSLGLGGCYGLSATEESLEVISGSMAPVLSAHSDHRLPTVVTLCGETFDLSRKSVYERLEFEFIRAVNHPGQVALWQRRAALFFPFIEAELKAAGLPDDLKYLAVAESDLRPWVASPAGALGLWQFMPPTARQYGVTVNKTTDQRQLPELLIKAATTYLKYLHTRFNSWSLAMAAYNVGENRISRDLTKQGVKSYFELDLPRETERYVYRIAAIKIILENATLYGLSKPIPLAQYQPRPFTERQIDISPPASWPQVARQLGCDYMSLRILNPHIRRTPLSGTYTLRVPVS